jgi:hypothetical protein
MYNEEMAYDILDNFLEPEQHKAIESAMMDYNFPWYYNDSVNSWKVEGSFYDWQFGHNFYRNSHTNAQQMSPYFQLLDPIWEKVEPTAILRVKANLNPITPEHYYGGWHNDFDFPCKTAVYYVNTNNGWTEFKETGERVESVANRLVIFDSDMEHTGVTTTDTKARCLININWV